MTAFLGSTENEGHQRAELTAVVLVNLGTPDAPTPSALRRYLAEFLSDPRVVETPRWLWWLILHGVILLSIHWADGALCLALEELADRVPPGRQRLENPRGMRHNGSHSPSLNSGGINWAFSGCP